MVSNVLVINDVIALANLMILGFLFVVLDMVFSLFNRFILSHLDLKQAVKARTHELKIINAELDSMTHIDPLTTIYNRRSFEDTLNCLITTNSKVENNYWLALLDIDNFKKSMTPMATISATSL